ncbi:MAG: GNAT family N-acetyltransferase [bacterium]|nr:GNAT family N-acetyltransferase [bacterium]
MAYLNWDTKVITDFSPENVAAMYDAGYVLTRVDKGVMNKTRSYRVDLSAYEASSENRRIMRKSEHIALRRESIPYTAYDWSIGKLAKDFYDKLGADFSANKVKEIMTESEKSSFNTLLVFTGPRGDVGFVVCYESRDILHYSYPFYVEDPAEPSRGLGMMTKAVEWAKENGKRYLYLGSLQRPSDTYKLQFRGGEWFDGEKWQIDTEPLKNILKGI